MSINPERNWTPEEFAALCAAAEDPTASPETLLRIEEETDSRGAEPHHVHHLCSLLLCHPNAPRGLLTRNASSTRDTSLSPRPFFAEAFIRNPALPLLCLEHPDLLNDFEPLLLQTLLTYPALPVAFIALCRAHESPSIADEARAHITVAGELDPTNSAWEEIALDALSGVPVRNWDDLWELIEHERAPRELAERLGFAAVHPPEYALMQQMREKAADFDSNSPPLDISQPPGGWERLHEDKARVRVLVSDPRTPADILLHCRQSRYADALAVHPNATAELLDGVLEYIPRGGTKYQLLAFACALLSQPKARPELVRHVVQEVGPREYPTTGFEPLYRRFLRWHPALVDDPPVLPDPESLRWANDQNSLEDVLYLTTSPAPVQIWPGPRSRPWQIRLAWALNPSVEEERRRFLADDAHRLVRVAARARQLFPYKTLLGVPGAPSPNRAGMRGQT